jgi:hypothetical protein
MGRAAELIRLLDMAPQFVDPNPGRDHIDGLEHNLRVATLANRWAMGMAWPIGTDTTKFINEITFMGLVHDLARPLSDPYHGEVIAEIVRDMVEWDTYNVLRTHGQYQAAWVHKDPAEILEPNASWRYLGKALCAWEVGSFMTNWHFTTLTKTDAVTLIYKICEGHL